MSASRRWQRACSIRPRPGRRRPPPPATGRPGGIRTLLGAAGLFTGGLLFIFLGLVIVLAVTRPTGPALAAPAPATSTPARPTPTAKLPAVPGMTYRTKNLDRLWVDPLGVSAWNRADDNGDRKGQDRIDDAFDNFFIKPGTRVRVRQIGAGQLKQLEVLDGEYVGRRGWTDTYSDAQYEPA